MKVNASQ